jgi:hypothetical protein
VDEDEKANAQQLKKKRKQGEEVSSLSPMCEVKINSRKSLGRVAKTEEAARQYRGLCNVHPPRCAIRRDPGYVFAVWSHCGRD